MKAFTLGGIFIFAVVAGAFSLKRSTPSTPPPAIPFKGNPRCLAAYQKLYANAVSRWTVVFGYKDSRPARFVGDRYERAALVQRLNKLEFKRTADNDDLFTRTVRGPDGKEKKIEMLVVQSSVGPDDDANSKDPFQKWQSAYAEKTFSDSLQFSDVVLYNGHSRDGGGPDFTRPRCRKDGHVDYDWYQKNKPGLRSMTKKLKEPHSKTQLIGLYSCASDRHFKEKIKKAHAKVGIIGSHSLLYYSDALDDLFLTIGYLSEQKCQEDFNLLGTYVMGFF